MTLSSLSTNWNRLLEFDSGQVIEPALRRQLESVIGRSLSDVRIHSGERANDFAASCGARALAFSNHIVFAKDEYQPDTTEGRFLLAHELAHTLQQRESRGEPLGIGDAESGWERQADEAAAHMLRGERPVVAADDSRLIRRVIAIDRKSAKLRVTARPTVNAPVVASPVMSFTSGGFRAAGEVTLTGTNLFDIPLGWVLGFIQAQWIETNWVYYRGQQNNHGSLFLQRARPPARPAQPCRDTLGAVSDIFYDMQIGRGLAPGLIPAFPLRLAATHADFPSESANLIETNNLTGQRNFLRECQLEFHFATILTVRDPQQNFHHLKSVYWNMHWQATFLPTNFANALTTPWTISLTANGNAGNVGGIIEGAPNDKRFAGVLTTVQTKNCNQVFQAAVANPNRRESKIWDNFDVRR